MPAKKKEETTPADKAPTKSVKTKKAAAAAMKFDVLGEETPSIKDILGNYGISRGYKTASEIEMEYLPCQWLPLKWFLGGHGIPRHCISEFLGVHNVGKSSLLFSTLCECVRNNMICLYLNGDAKEAPTTQWLRRLTGEPLDRADKILDRITIPEEQPLNLKEMDTMMREWLLAIRKSGIPREVHLVVAIDAIDNLRHPEDEAATFDSSDKKATLDNLKSMDDRYKGIAKKGKWFTDWIESLNNVLLKENFTIICSASQGTSINSMGHQKSAHNENSRQGGKARDRRNAFTANLADEGVIAESAAKTKVGNSVRFTMLRNSYGPNVRSFSFEFRNDHFKNDTDTKLEHPINMSKAMIKLITDYKIFSIPNPTGGKYTWLEQDLIKVTPDELCAHITNTPELIAKVNEILGIYA